MRDFLKSKGNRLQSRGAGLIHRICRNSLRNTAAHRDLTRNVGTAACLARISDDRLFDLLRRYPCAIERGLRGYYSHVGRSHVSERAAKLTDRRAYGGEDEDAFQNELLKGQQCHLNRSSWRSRACKLSAMDVLYGIHSVEEALRARSRSLDHLEVARDRHDQRLQSLIDKARDEGVSLRFVPRDQLDRLARSKSHQGVVAVVANKSYSDLDEILATRNEHSFIVVLDGIEDPHNLGALIRTADGAGADGVVIPERRSAAVNATVVKTSAGATEHVKIARVVNLARALDELKGKNIWTIGLDERGVKHYDELNYRIDCAIVLGAEGHGLHDLIRKKCDYLVSIPMAGRVPSLNVSVAGAVVMYEVARQRRSREASRLEENPVREHKGLGS